MEGRSLEAVEDQRRGLVQQVVDHTEHLDFLILELATDAALTGRNPST